MVTVDAATREFLLACQADGLKPATQTWYAVRLGAFVRHCSGLTIEEITVTVMREYVIYLRSRQTRFEGSYRPTVGGGLSIYTLRGHIKALRKFFDWCVAEYQLDPRLNPMPRIRLPSRPKLLPKAIALDDLQKLFAATDDSILGIRDRAILAFLTDTGCRAGGLLTLRLDDLDLVAGRARVSEKFDKTRIVPFTTYTANLLRQWLAVRPPEAPTVFCSLGPNRYARPLYMSGLHHLLGRLKKKSGVTGRVNPHSFRHGFAREYLKNGGDLATLARLMGHSNVSVTAEFYAVFTEEELADKHAQFSPMRSLYANHSTDEST